MSTKKESVEELFDVIFKKKKKVEETDSKTDRWELMNELVQELIDINNIEYIDPDSREKKYREPRHWHIFLLINIFRWTLERAGKMYNKDHATAINSTKRILEWTNHDRGFQRQYRVVIKRCLEFDPEIFSEKKWGKLV